jgi:hypothetical protein
MNSESIFNFFSFDQRIRKPRIRMFSKIQQTSFRWITAKSARTSGLRNILMATLTTENLSYRKVRLAINFNVVSCCSNYI